jgi:hypothetical protein
MALCQCRGGSRNPESPRRASPPLQGKHFATLAVIVLVGASAVTLLFLGARSRERASVQEIFENNAHDRTLALSSNVADVANGGGPHAVCLVRVRLALGEGVLGPLVPAALFGSPKAQQLQQHPRHIPLRYAHVSFLGLGTSTALCLC